MRQVKIMCQMALVVALGISHEDRDNRCSSGYILSNEKRMKNIVGLLCKTQINGHKMVRKSPFLFPSFTASSALASRVLNEFP